MPRSKKSQSAHDKKVREEAKKLMNQGFEVEADIDSFNQPGTIGGFRPDINAVKGKQKKIIEVETSDSKNSARDQKQLKKPFVRQIIEVKKQLSEE